MEDSSIRPPTGEDGTPNKDAERLDLLLKILLTADGLADKLIQLTDRQEELAEMFAFLLDKVSLKLTEKQIHAMIDEWEAEQKRRQKANIGVPRRLLKYDRAR